ENPFEEGEGVGGSYVPDYDPASTMLGEAQWAWLEEQLKVPADLRIIASSVQVIANRHRFEKWGNFPLERQRLFDLIKKTKANGVVIVSGDRHTAEIDRIEDEVGYPLFDVTSSSLNLGHPWRSEINEHRVGGMYFDDNFGMIDIDWSQEDPLIRLQVLDGSGEVAIQQRVRLNDLWPYSEDHLPPGFVSLFNGRDLSGWVGDTKGYQAQDGILLCKPG
ncbi:MAG: alkaline phosphatase D family protein, partial [Candidatus Omnitrophica bacterium]|nr:alkaline phosphatase D family protein [Candidatus Omnitrophota bacterium]